MPKGTGRPRKAIQRKALRKAQDHAMKIKQIRSSASRSATSIVMRKVQVRGKDAKR